MKNSLENRTENESLANVTTIQEKPCPYDGVLYSKVPGYIEGYGCPVCKAIGFSHLSIVEATC